VAKFACPYCDGGYVHTSGIIPNPNEWLVISATKWCELPDSVDPNDLYPIAKSLYKCVNCDAIGVFWNGHAGRLTWYGPPDGETA
jgi:hypothetical protein